MSDDFETVRSALAATWEWDSNDPSREALSRIEARLSTAEEALREIAGKARALRQWQIERLAEDARNALQSEHQKADWQSLQHGRTFMNAQPNHKKEPIDR